MLEDRANLGVRVRPANRNSLKRRRLYDRAENHVTRIEARVNTAQDYTKALMRAVPVPIPRRGESDLRRVLQIQLSNNINCLVDGGEGGIRTPGTLARTPHFECGAIDHSATSPGATARPKTPAARSARRLAWAFTAGKTASPPGQGRVLNR